MAQKIIRTGNYFLVGLGIGSLMGVLFMPKSGAETRGYAAERTRERNKFARKKVRELRDRAEDTVELGKKIVAQTEVRVAAAIDAGIETYNRERAKTQVS